MPGETSHGLRGDYGGARADCTVDQAYTAEQQERWRRLYRRQMGLVPGLACDEYVEATRPDFTPFYEELAGLEEIPANGTAPGDILASLD